MTDKVHVYRSSSLFSRSYLGRPSQGKVLERIDKNIGNQIWDMVKEFIFVIGTNYFAEVKCFSIVFMAKAVII